MHDGQEITVLVYDRQGDAAVPRSSAVRVLRQPDVSVLDKAKNLFILSSATALPSIAEFVRSANRRHHLRALFVREDADPRWLPQLFDRANLRTLRNTLVHSGPELPRRVITAWRLGAQDHLIADGRVIDDHLCVVNCALERFEVSFDVMPALKRLPQDKREAFDIAEDGSYLHWPELDIHLDLDAIRSATDPGWSARAETARIAHDKRFGKAVATVRKAHGLRQSDIPDLSERQVRRIERGARTTIATLERLAKAHGMNLDEYLNAVSRVVEKKPQTGD